LGSCIESGGGGAVMKTFLRAQIVLAALLGCGAAMAADMPVKAPVYKAPIVAVSIWTGCYVGGNLGYSQGRVRDSADYLPSFGVRGTALTTSRNLDHDLPGAIGGGQLGCNWEQPLRQSHRFVVGFETDFQWTGERGGRNCSETYGGAGYPTTLGTGPLGTFNCSKDTRLQWLSTARLRGGVAIDRVFFYVTGGLAVGRISADDFASWSYLLGLTFAGASSTDTTKVGGTVGVGVESLVTSQVSIKAEYLYVDLGDITTTTSFVNAGTCCDLFTNRRRIQDHIFRLGVNYMFGGPVVAKY
jgi:outer membrane immunogenic protein